MVKAAIFTAYGSAEEVLSIEERALPELNAGEVTVAIRSSGINPSDVKKRAGARACLDEGFVVPHSDGAGEITAVGRGVPKHWIGERVWLYNTQHQRAWGTACEAVNVPLSLTAPLPASQSFEAGAALGVPLMTAHRGLTSAGNIDGATVLVTGAQGRVGHYAVQVAKWLGAEVVATVGSEEAKDEIYDLGADLVVNFRDPEHTQQVMAHTQQAGVDHAVEVEFGGNFKTTLSIMKDNSCIASYASGAAPVLELPFYDLMFHNIAIHPFIVYDMPEAAKASAIATATDMLSAEALVHRLGAQFSLDEIVKAHQCVELASCRGAVVVQP